MISKMISKCQIELRDGFTLYSWRHMGVDVHRDRDCRMAQSLLYHLRMNTARQQLRCIAVAEVVEANALPLMCATAMSFGVFRSSIRVRSCAGRFRRCGDEYKAALMLRAAIAQSVY